MKLNTELSHDAEYLGDIQENRVGIDKSNLDFITTLLTSNLYSKPLESFLRETIANAYDSHTEAGTDEHILLLIQDSGCKDYTNYTNNYTISIRDYGVGVSPERFEKIYRNIGSSTKRESNDYIGMFGIGRFSCLSCADVAGINSYYNGTKYSYIMYKNGGGINIDKVSETTGDFKNGLEVSIQISTTTNNDWDNAILHLCMFEKLHITYNGENYALKGLVSGFNERKIVHYNAFSICSSLISRENYFKVGNVLYKAPKEYISLKTCKGLIIDLPIGSVDITPNRESLQYTDYTKRTIAKRVEETKNELQEIVNSQIAGDLTMETFFVQFCNSLFYNIKVKDISFPVYKEDVEVDMSSVTIGGNPIPVGYDKFLKEVRYLGIDKSFISKQVNESIYRRAVDNSIAALVRGTCRLVVKEDKVTKQVTWSYFLQNNKNSAVVLTQENLDLYKKGIIDDARGYLSYSISTLEECVDFLFSNIKIGKISNNDVPHSYIERYKEIQREKRKKTISSDIPVRDYRNFGYRKKYFRNISDNKGLIIYTKHMQDDEVLRNLSLLVDDLDVGAVISLKEEYLPSLANNRKFILLDNFLYLRNNLISKLVTAKIILDKFEKGFASYIISRLGTLPIRREFLKKYSKEASFIAQHPHFVGEILQDLCKYYTEKGWVNEYDIKYFSLSEEELQVASTWDTMLDNRNAVIQRMIFDKFGKIPKIGLLPIKMPKLKYIKEKDNESI